MDLVQLRSFVEVAERGTVAAAAVAQGYTAPAVSQHLAKLEAELGVALFDRVRGRLVLSPAGAALLPVALDMLDLDERGRTAVEHADVVPHVVIAGFASALAAVVIPHLDGLRAIATVELREAEDDEALRDLGLGAVDLVLTQEYDGIPIDRNRRLTFTPLVTDRLVLVLPPDRRRSTRLRQLADEPWLLNGQATRCAQATRHLFTQVGIAPPIVGAVADHATLLGLVAAGQGATVLPSLALGDRAADVTVATEDLGMTRTIVAVTRNATTSTLAPVLTVLASTKPPPRRNLHARSR